MPIEVKGLTIEDGQKKIKENSIVFQDPYRREVYAKTKDECVGISNKVNDCVKKGLTKSNVFIITLGLIEIFKCKITDAYLSKVLLSFGSKVIINSKLTNDKSFNSSSVCSVGLRIRIDLFLLYEL